MSMLLALVAIAGPGEADQRLSRMTNLYEYACLKAFPDDKAVEALMTAQKARELTPEEVKITMGNDPARGWELADGRATVWIEYPPFHACSVRWNAPAIGDLSAYRLAADTYERAVGGFHPVDAYNADQGAIHVHGIGEKRTLRDKSTESLFVIDQQISDPKRREAGETGVVLRFVHQFGPAPSASGK
jgi:hypothetical protein